MGNLQIRPHARNPNLWWVSSQGDDVAYITRPGNAFISPGPPTSGNQAMPTSSASVLIASMRRWRRWPEVFREAAGAAEKTRPKGN
jgi:hypothetical protein